jgi:ABC-type glycerol-3-phosphate transport system permease component
MAKKEISFWASQKLQARITSWMLYIIAWAGALVFVIPLVWMISTSLKAPDEIFTMPPKWLPYSQLYFKYDPSITAKFEGKIKIERDEDGTNRIQLGTFSQVIPPYAVLKVKNKDFVAKGDMIATLPKSGIIKITENADLTKVIRLTDPASGLVIKEFNITQDTKPVVKDGDSVKLGDKIADVNPQWSNYAKAWAPKALDETFNKYFLNTFIITICGIFGTLLSSAFVAYGFSRFKFPFRDELFMVMVATMMIPAQVTMIPTFILFKWLGWIDTFAPLIVPTFFGGGAFNIFLMRQFFMTIPYELDDAAKIDGCNYFQIFWQILLPLVKPAMASIAIFSFVYNWNDFMNPLIYLNSTSNYTLALGLQTFTTMYGTDYNLMMAASTVVLMPILIAFFFGQRFFIEGVATTGLKG